MKEIIRSRLPERLAGRLPPPLVEIGVGLLVPILFLLLRLALIPVAGDSAPYALVFLAIVIACLLAGWRSGLVALVVGQALAWMLIARGESTDVRLGAFVIATISQLIILLVIT